MKTSTQVLDSFRFSRARLPAILMGIALLAPLARAMPGPPTPLSALAEQAELVLVGRVATIEPAGDAGDAYGLAYSDATMEVEEVLKGEAGGRSVRVRYPSNLACPPPPAFALDRRFLVFLNVSESSGMFETINLDNGAKYLCDDEHHAAYVARTCEILEVLRITDAAERRRETLDWLVRCAERRPTAWEGAYELSGQAQWLSAADGHRVTAPAAELTPAQKDRLLDALLAYREDDPEALRLVRAVAATKDLRAVDFFSRAFELAAADPRTCPAVSPAHYMGALGELLGWPAGVALADDYYALEKHSSQSEIREKFRKGLAKRLKAIRTPSAARRPAAGEAGGTATRARQERDAAAPDSPTGPAGGAPGAALPRAERPPLGESESSAEVAATLEELVARFGHPGRNTFYVSRADASRPRTHAFWEEDRTVLVLESPLDHSSVDYARLYTDGRVGLEARGDADAAERSGSAPASTRAWAEEVVRECKLSGEKIVILKEAAVATRRP